MAYIPETPGEDIEFDKPGIPTPSWGDDDGGSSSGYSGQMVLIEAITTEAADYSLSYSVEPNGDPYEFKALGVLINTKKGSVNSDLVVTALHNKDVVQVGLIKNGMSSENDKYGSVKMQLSNGVWETFGSVAVNGYTQQIEQLTGTSMMYMFNTKWSEYPYIDEVHIAPKVNGNTIPAGTYIQIFAVRV